MEKFEDVPIGRVLNGAVFKGGLLIMDFFGGGVVNGRFFNGEVLNDVIINDIFVNDRVISQGLIFEGRVKWGS